MSPPIAHSLSCLSKYKANTKITYSKSGPWENGKFPTLKLYSPGSKPWDLCEIIQNIGNVDGHSQGLRNVNNSFMTDGFQVSWGLVYK